MKVLKTKDIVLVSLVPNKTADRVIDFGSPQIPVSVRVFTKSGKPTGIRVRKKSIDPSCPFPYHKLSRKHVDIAKHILKTQSLLASRQLAKELLQCVK